MERNITSEENSIGLFQAICFTTKKAQPLWESCSGRHLKTLNVKAKLNNKRYPLHTALTYIALSVQTQ